MSSNRSISFKNVVKQFYVREDRTVKEIIPSLLGGKGWAKQHTVLNKISFDIDAGETVGIVGKNGAGKSTILKLIAGVTYPNKGKVIVKAKVAPLIELSAGFHHELTGYENIFLNAAILGMHKKQIDQKVEEIISFSELGSYINEPVKRYSSGMYMRLGFSVAVQTPAPVLLIDEVLAVGDAKFQNKCLQKLEEIKQAKKKTIVFVSHDENAVRDFCDRALLLHGGDIVADGSPAKIFQKYHSLE